MVGGAGVVVEGVVVVGVEGVAVGRGLERGLGNEEWTELRFWVW